MTLLQTIENRQGVLRVKELAAMLGVTPAHLYNQISLGFLPSVRIAGAIRLDPVEIAAWLREGRPKRARASGSCRGGRRP